MILLLDDPPDDEVVDPPDVEPSTARFDLGPYSEPSVPPWNDGEVSGLPTFFYEYIRGAELPDLHLRWNDGETPPRPIDFSVGYTFTLRVGSFNEAALLVKSSGIIGGDGFVDITWGGGSADLNSLPVGRYDATLIARRTIDAKDRIRPGEIVIAPGIL